MLEVVAVNYYDYRGKRYTAVQLSEMSGIPSATIRDRVRRGYSVDEAVKMSASHDSLQAFGDASYWDDWIGRSTSELYDVYWKWCVKHGYKPLQHKGFTRQLLTTYPMLKVIPTKTKNGYKRIIRLNDFYSMR